MASSANKPDGLVIIPPEEVRQFLWVQPVRHLWGVGPKSEEAFKRIGIETIGDLAKTDGGMLKKMFGIAGPALKKMATGEGDDDVRPSDIEHEAKSMGHEHTFHRDTNNQDEVIGLLLYLSDRVSRRLRQSGCKGKTVTLKIRKSSYKLVTRAATLKEYFDTEKTIFRTAKMLLLKNRFLDEPIRLLGVSVSTLRSKRDPYYNELLSGDDPRIKSEKIDLLLDCLRDRHGEESIFFAGSRVF